MYTRSCFLVLLAVAAMIGFGFIAGDQVDAQQKTTTTPVASPTPPIDEEDEVVKVETESVSVLFTAQDKTRRLLTNLKAEDVRILENGQVQEISAFSRQVDLPLSL